MSKCTSKWLFATCTVTALLLAPILAGTAAAASASAAAAFTARYEHEADIEAELLASAQAQSALTASSAQFDVAITALNSQIATLYRSEQALEAVGLTLGALPTSQQTPDLRARRTQLQARLDTLQSQLRSLAHKHGGDHSAQKELQSQRRRLHTEIADVKRALRRLEQQLQHTAKDRSRWQTHPEDGALGRLQTAIDDLQVASIHATLAWIQAEHPRSAVLQPSSITGLTYAQTTVPKPGNKQPAVTDVVTVPPVVVGVSHATLVDTGTYSLAKGHPHPGVRIDAVTGTLTVTSSAHPGTYVIVYTQDGVSEEVTLEIT